MTKKLDFDFLAINKEWLGIGLNPLELLIVSQVAEFNRNTGDCFISDDKLAESFGVSSATVKRAISNLDKAGIIIRITNNVRGGKERHMKVNHKRIQEIIENLKKEEEESTSINLSLDECLQESNCSLSSINLSLVKEQNDTIKENIKEKEKDNIGNEFQPSAETSFPLDESQEEGSSFANPKVVDREWFKQRYNHTDWIERSQVCGIYYHTPTKRFYKVKIPS